MYSQPNLYGTPCLTNRLGSVNCVKPNQRGFSPKLILIAPTFWSKIFYWIHLAIERVQTIAERNV